MVVTQREWDALYTADRIVKGLGGAGISAAGMDIGKDDITYNGELVVISDAVKTPVNPPVATPPVSE
jgi:hypothetical protein